ncbi:GTPase IMAP family member 7-like [Crotalus adamanteus]|uniref:GTPase IMAP family member 7-like n=1 Tax=Crotalus adamanteus TaxID=8729 RepID=A0AAW1B1Z5_CROAD
MAVDSGQGGDSMDAARGLPWAGWGPDPRIVLLAGPEVGKSATGKHHPGKPRPFESESCYRSISKDCQREESLWNGRKVVVVDTPGLFRPWGSESLKPIVELVKCMKFCAPGPHAILLVMRLGRWTQEEKETLQLVKEVFRDRKGKNYLILLFTHKEDLEGETLEEFIAQRDVALRELVAYWWAPLPWPSTNKAEGEERESQVAELKRMIDQLVGKNRDVTCYLEVLLRVDHKALQRNAWPLLVFSPLTDAEKAFSRRSKGHNPAFPSF